jgi:hypothetical protein
MVPTPGATHPAQVIKNAVAGAEKLERILVAALLA